MDTRPSEVSAGRVAELSVSSKARVNAMPILGGETWVLGGGSVFFRVGQLYPQRFANRKRSRVWKIARLKWVHDMGPGTAELSCRPRDASVSQNCIHLWVEQLRDCQGSRLNKMRARWGLNGLCFLN